MSQATPSVVSTPSGPRKAAGPNPPAAPRVPSARSAGQQRSALPAGTAELWQRLSDWQCVGLLAVISTAFFGFAARLRFLHATVAGDEPHYLIFNVALKKYHSLNVLPVYENRDYWSFYPAPLEPHTSPGPDGTLLPLHGFGGPLLWHIPYLIFGNGGPLAFIVLVSVLTVVNIFFFLRELNISQLYAGLVTLLFAVGSPIYIYSSMLFIEPIAALAVLYAVRVLLRPSLSGWRVAVASVGLGIIPWVHGRFAIFSVLLGAMLLLRLYRERGLSAPRLYLSLLVPVGLLLLGYEFYNVLVWHTINPAPANANVGNGVFQIPLHEGFLGLLLDRSYGLISNFPLIALAIPGLLLAVRRGSLQVHGVLAIVVLPYLALVSTFSMWWGGYCPPARYLVAVAPLLAYYVAVTLQRLHNWLLSAAAILFALFSVMLAIVGEARPELRWNWHEWPPGQAMEGLAAFIKVPFVHLVPSSFLPHQTATFALWIVVLVAGSVALGLLGRRTPVSRIPQPAVRVFR